MKVWNASQLDPRSKVVTLKDVNKQIMLTEGYRVEGQGMALRNPAGKCIAVFAGSSLYTGNADEPTDVEDAIAVGLWLMSKKVRTK